MARRLSERQRLAQKLEALTDSEIAEVLDYIALIEPVSKSTAPVVRDDELVAMLSDARENRRARQAFAWEALRRRAERRIVPGSRA
jgi:hypothetical protein